MNKYRTLTEEQLSARLNDGDDLAYTEIYDRYWLIMFRFAYKLTQDYDEAKDIVQDSFLTLLNNMGIPDYFRDTLKSYLFTTIKNRYIDYSLKEKRKSNYIQGLTDYLNAATYHADDQLNAKELSRLIEKEIAAMSPLSQTIFEMSRKEYLSRKQIAEKLNISENTVKKQIENILKRLRSRLTMFICFQIMSFLLWLHRSL